MVFTNSAVAVLVPGGGAAATILASSTGAEAVTGTSTSAFAVPDRFSDEEAAPLFCAGAIGFRSLNLAGIEE